MPEAFARVFPKSIKITEKYAYQAHIAYTSQIEEKADEKPSGLIESLIPYDGEKYFTRQAVTDIHRQCRQLPDSEEATIRIGYLALSKYKGLGLENAEAIHYDVTPLELKLREHKLPTAATLLGNPNSCRITYEYAPNAPRIIPVKLKIQLDDEQLVEAPKTIWALLDGHELQGEERKQLEEAAKMIQQQERSSGAFRFTFRVILKLPDGVGSENDTTPPKLNRLSLRWPVTISDEHIHFKVGDKKPTTTPTFYYNPEQGRLDWRNLPFVAPQNKSKDTGLYVYRTLPMHLTVQQPGELYKIETLEGKAEIELSRAFSGLQVEHFDATGQKSDKAQVNIQAKTQFTIDFKLDLTAIFDRNVMAPYCQLHFDGVVLDEMRLRDIENILAYYGFTTRLRRLNAQGHPLRRYLIAGCQKRNMAHSWLWLLVEGKPAQTLRQKTIPGHQTYITHLETGQLTIYMRGQWAGDTQEMNSLMNQVQSQLKEQFHYLSTPD